MSASVSYQACSVKRRRSTKDEMAALYAALNSIVDSRPSDVWGCRQIYYQTVVRGLVEKSDKNANRIGAALIHMRDNGLLDPDRIEDESREILDGRDGFGVEDIVDVIPASLESNFWRDRDVHLQIWLEKRGLSEQARRVTSAYHVPLIPAGGFASISIVRRAARLLLDSDKPRAVIMHLSDFDGSGKIAADAIERRLRDAAPGVRIDYERIGLSLAQIRRFGLVTQDFARDPSNQHTRDWPHKFTAQLDALLPEQLRAIIEENINRYMTAGERDEIVAVQEVTRDRLVRMLQSDEFQALRQIFRVDEEAR